MKQKYASVGLNYDLIVDKYPDLNEYEENCFSGSGAAPGADGF